MLMKNGWNIRSNESMSATLEFDLLVNNQLSEAVRAQKQSIIDLLASSDSTVDIMRESLELSLLENADLLSTSQYTEAQAFIESIDVNTNSETMLEFTLNFQRDIILAQAEMALSDLQTRLDNTPALQP